MGCYLLLHRRAILTLLSPNINMHILLSVVHTFLMVQLKGCYLLLHRRAILTLLSPNINMHILLSVVHTFLMVQLKRICTKGKKFHVWGSFPLFS